MPWFRFTNDARLTLHFRNGTCSLAFANLADTDGWAWVARKEFGTREEIVLTRAGNVMALRAALVDSGFEVPAGSPAERVMRAAVKLGHAEDLPDDPHWREELLKARRAASQKSIPQFGGRGGLRGQR